MINFKDLLKELNNNADAYEELFNAVVINETGIRSLTPNYTATTGLYDLIIRFDKNVKILFNNEIVEVSPRVFWRLAQNIASIDNSHEVNQTTALLSFVIAKAVSNITEG